MKGGEKRMNILKKIKRLAIAALSVGGFGLLATVPAYASTWNTGDVYAGVGGGNYNVYDNAGVFKETISDGSGTQFTTGCAFNNSLDKLYTTNFSNQNVIVYNDPHPHTMAQTIVTGDASPESVVFASSGDFYIGHADGAHAIQRYNSAGVLQQAYAAAIEARGTDWLDLASDQKTMFYTSEGGLIKRFDVSGAGAQLADFASIGGINFALRLLPPGDGSGGLLVAHTANIKRLDGTGAVVKTYAVPGENNWFSLNLDPNGTSFWAGDSVTNNFYRFNIASGAVEVGPINTGSGTNFFGLCLKGELTAAQQQITLEPQTATNEVGENHTVTATVTSGGKPTSGVTVTFNVVSGPNFGTTGTGVTDARGNASFTYTSNGTAGTDTIEACFTDKAGTKHCARATKDWVAPTITLTPATAKNTVGTSHTVTATITLNGTPEPNVLVNFTVSGINTGATGTCSANANCTTDANGQVSFTYTSNGLAGTDTIQACKAKTGTKFCATATKDWVSLPGRMTGGGTIGDNLAKHGFELHCDTSQLPNNLEVNWDKGNKFHLDTLTAAGCSDDPLITPNPPAAGFDTYVGRGTGKFNGVSGYTAKWKFTDAGEPGVNDFATISIFDPSNVLVASFSGNLSKGNQQAHNP